MTYLRARWSSKALKMAGTSWKGVVGVKGVGRLGRAV